MKEALNVNNNQNLAKFPTLDVNLLQYSDKYFDDKYEYRHVILPKEFNKFVPRTHLMTETEWRNLGIQQSPGWVHYLLHAPEPHVLMFRRILQINNSESTTNVDETENDVGGVGNEAESNHDVGTIDYEMNEKDDASDISIDSNIAEICH